MTTQVNQKVTWCRLQNCRRHSSQHKLERERERTFSKTSERIRKCLVFCCRSLLSVKTSVHIMSMCQADKHDRRDEEAEEAAGHWPRSESVCSKSKCPDKTLTSLLHRQEWKSLLCLTLITGRVFISVLPLWKRRVLQFDLEEDAHKEIGCKFYSNVPVCQIFAFLLVLDTLDLTVTTSHIFVTPTRESDSVCVLCLLSYLSFLNPSSISFSPQALETRACLRLFTHHWPNSFPGSQWNGGGELNTCIMGKNRKTNKQNQVVLISQMLFTLYHRGVIKFCKCAQVQLVKHHFTYCVF